ncbi:MAG: hypothetical protein ACREPK_04580 [Rhodanobacteraceae bacterium]
MSKVGGCAACKELMEIGFSFLPLTIFSDRSEQLYSEHGGAPLQKVSYL